MLNRSRSHITILVSSLSLIVSLGAATVVVSNSATSRYRNPRTHRLVREFDSHAHEIATIERLHDQGNDWHARLRGRSGRNSDQAATFETPAFAVELSQETLTVQAPVTSIGWHSLQPPNTRGPPPSII